MAKLLNEHSITYEMLKSTFEDNCDDSQAFDSQLHEAGVKRKAWRDKIYGTILLGESRHKLVGFCLKRLL